MDVFRKILTGSRFLIIISVLGTLIGSIIVLGYSAATVIGVLISIIFQHQFSTNEVKIVAASSVELIDLFLLSTILYIVSLGLYKLFIDGTLPLPSWLVITDLNDLKERILGVIMVLLAITFLGYLVEWHFGDYSIAAVGVAVALVFFAVGYSLSKGALSGQLASEIQKENRNGESQMVDTQK